MGRSPCCSKVGLNRGAWTAAEDKILTDYIKLHGEGNWRGLAKKAGLKRCGKSCRLRWLNYLRPDIKRGNITEDEEELIIRLHKLLGNRWSLIAGRLPGRTDNEIKNYWNTTLGKRVHDHSSNSASIRKHSKQFDMKKKTGMASRAVPMPNSENMIHSPVVRTKARRFSKVFISQQQKEVETSKSFTKDSSNSNKIETGFTDGLLSLSPDEDNNLSEFISLEEQHVSDFISSGLAGLLEFSYGNEDSKALSSSLDDSLMICDEMLEDWTKSFFVQTEIISDGLESHSRVSDKSACK